MSRIDTTNIDALSGAVFFSVGRGTEGGSASYRLSVAGVTTTEWGQVAKVAANSGYSMGTIQVDFGQRGTWPVGAIAGRDLRPGEKTYVDAVIEQASAYSDAKRALSTVVVLAVRLPPIPKQIHGSPRLRPAAMRALWRYRDLPPRPRARPNESRAQAIPGQRAGTTSACATRRRRAPG